MLDRDARNARHDRLHRPRQRDQMKARAFLINVARAELVDQDALSEALAERRIAGTALDVWHRYPSEAGLMAPARRGPSTICRTCR